MSENWDILATRCLGNQDVGCLVDFETFLLLFGLIARYFSPPSRISQEQDKERGFYQRTTSLNNFVDDIPASPVPKLGLRLYLQRRVDQQAASRSPLTNAGLTSARLACGPNLAEIFPVLEFCILSLLWSRWNLRGKKQK